MASLSAKDLLELASEAESFAAIGRQVLNSFGPLVKEALIDAGKAMIDVRIAVRKYAKEQGMSAEQIDLAMADMNQIVVAATTKSKGKKKDE